MKTAPLTQLGHISVATFLREYWQKKPVLIRQAFANFSSPLSADELAGLSLEDDVVSRLVIEDPDQLDWSLEHGPFHEDRFSTLPDDHWSLLIQHADGLDPEVNGLLQAFRFIPNWRLDDIMISYAPDKGGVGPHFDYYDVFLLQAEGQRRWRLGQACSSESELIPNQPMKILQDFHTAADYLLNPGDMLYVPAKIAHWGEAVGESITFSIGFRAPSHGDALLEIAQELSVFGTEDERYTDSDLSRQRHAGEIPLETLQYFQQMIVEKSQNPAIVARWLGLSSTQLHQDYPEDYIDSVDTADLPSEKALQLSTFCRCCYFVGEKTTSLFVNGREWNCSHAFAQRLSDYAAFYQTEFENLDTNVLNDLINLSYIVFAESSS